MIKFEFSGLESKDALTSPFAEQMLEPMEGGGVIQDIELQLFYLSVDELKEQQDQIAKVCKNPYTCMLILKGPAADPMPFDISIFTLVLSDQMPISTIKQNFAEVVDLYARCVEKIENNKRLERVIKGTRVGVWEWNVQTGWVNFNERWAEIIGYKLDELQPVSIDTWMKYAHPDDLVESNRRLQEHFRGDVEYYDFETRMKHKDGHWVWIHDRGKVFEWSEDGEPLMMSGSHIDITDRKELEQKLTKSDDQKRVLLSEIHHRVKNHLHIIIGYLQLKRLQSEDQNFQEVAREAEKMILAVARMHNILYQQESFDTIIIGNYLLDICKAISLEAPELTINFNVKTNGIELGTSSSLNVGLMMNEIITNSIKYASNKNNELDIEVEIKADGTLIVRDNGEGFPQEILDDPMHNDSLGMSLLSSISEELGSKLQLQNDNGAVVIFEKLEI